ncbi:uncharacterized protein EV154DRAFT_161679 [Mucor mucedo]|uniref:uncharacterized protein n=1 Tax=Mucor mucedo TaxID=29922 RepID=UPI00221FD8D7|nr:uncharacterized protein EV154DRAFT_161679 [Mucor mucedo]KAI7865647.1 hypothetical protein EV154DRAFT_161679 [Mucor mucedo]
MEAIVRRIIYKSPLEVYQYVITKANISPSEMLEEILEEQSKTELLLNYLMISDYIDIFQQVFQLSGVLSILNLSSNFLDDEDLSELLYNSSKSITELDLSGNLLTADCLDSIMGFSKLRKLILSNNPLGPVILQRLPELLTKIPSILDIDLSDTNLGEETPFDTAISEAYKNYRITAPMDSGLTIRISDNHFTKDTLCHWTPLWKNLKQVSCLQLSSISSETAWENFDMLLELPKLSKLILNRSTRTSLDLCDLKQLFKIKSSFDHLDLANCSLTGEGSDNIKYSLEFELMQPLRYEIACLLFQRKLNKGSKANTP